MEKKGTDRHPIGEEKEGNTEPPSPDANKSKNKQPTRKKFYCFTMFDIIGNEDIIKKWLLDNCKKSFVGYEICPTTHRPHLQGFFEFNKKARITEIQNKPIKWSKLIPCDGNEEQNLTYCSKDGNLWFQHPKPRKPLKLITELRPFQTEIFNIMKQEPDDRTIMWIYDHNGKAGKTQFCKYVVAHLDACYITSGKTSDIINLVYNHLQRTELEIVLLNLPRDQPRVDYNALEQIKDGIICNTKYETGTILTNSPHLIIFSNQLPDTYKLTQDRWDIRTVDENFNLIPYHNTSIDELKKQVCPL